MRVNRERKVYRIENGVFKRIFLRIRGKLLRVGEKQILRSLWNETVSRSEFPTLQGDSKTDVLIIGGGIAGILTTYFLQEKGVPYVLVEKDRICSGTTGNTTAKITFQHGFIYHKLLRSSGLKKTQMYLNANRAAFEKYAELCRQIDCSYEVKNNFVYAVNDRRKLDEELSALSRTAMTRCLPGICRCRSIPWAPSALRSRRSFIR